MWWYQAVLPLLRKDGVHFLRSGTITVKSVLNRSIKPKGYGLFPFPKKIVSVLGAKPFMVSQEANSKWLSAFFLPQKHPKASFMNSISLVNVK